MRLLFQNNILCRWGLAEVTQGHGMALVGAEGHRSPSCLWWGGKAWLPWAWLLFPPMSPGENRTSCLFYRLSVKCRGWQLTVLLLDASHSLMPTTWMVGTISAQPSLTVFVIHRNYNVSFDHLCRYWSSVALEAEQKENFCKYKMHT